ncbi:hypothetical protein [Yoonia sp. BS5-3]|uniref:Uncharacterized protein n=1 Tax=Yoonia phaeophyticola TaxID=3137369 RepID=A0ABZ2V1I8_9RHOB
MTDDKKFVPDFDALRAIRTVENPTIDELVSAAGLDPKEDLQYTDLRSVDWRGTNKSDYNLNGALLDSEEEYPDLSEKHFVGSKLAQKPRMGFPGLVNIDVWRNEFSDKDGYSDLFIDVSFGTERFSVELGDSHFLQCKITLRRAHIDITMPAEGPYRIVRPRHGVVTNRQLQFSSSNTTSSSKSSETVGSATTSMALKALGVSASVTKNNERSLTETLEFGTVQFSGQPLENGYSIEFEPLDDTFLKGRPWPIAEEFPVASIRLTGEAGDIAPDVLVEVSCLREDIVVSDIKIVPEGFSDRLREILGFQSLNSRLAMDKIVERLEERSLEQGDLRTDFSKIRLAASSPRVE